MAKKKTPFGFPGMTGGTMSPPTMRRPTRAALGGTVPRGGRMRMPPQVGGAAGARGGIRVPTMPGAKTPRKRVSQATRRRKTS